MFAESACFPLAIATTRDQQLGSSVVGTRVTSQRADVAGTLCYVEHKTRVSVRKHVSSDFRLGAGLELLGGSIASLFGVPALYFGLPIVFDGLLTAVYIKGQDLKVSVRATWESSNDTAACKGKP
jgi:hypothetical protein